MRLSIPDLLPETDYAIQVRSVSGKDVSEWSPRFLFTTIDDTVQPLVPGNVTWDFVEENFRANWDKVTLNTDGSHPKIIRYDIEVTGGGVTKRIAYTPTSDARLEWKLTPEKAKALFGALTTTVTFRVRAVNFSKMESDWSATLSATMGAPDAPTNAVVEELTEAIKISWTAPANAANVIGYRVYVGLTAGFTPTVANKIYEGAATTMTFNTSTFQLQYFKIRSYSKYGLESTDLLAQGTPKSPYGADTTPPDVPTALAVALDRTGAVAKANVSWTFSNAGANADIQAFAIRWRKVGQSDTEWRVNFADKAARTLGIDLPQPFANYEFQISSVDSTAHYSAWSASVNLTGAISGAPPQVTGVTATSSLDGVQLKWNASTAADVVNGGYYHVQIATNAGFTTGLLNYDTGNTYLDVNGLAANTTYYYQVKAVDTEALSGPYSTAGSIATTSFPVPSPSDGNPPASSPTPTVSGGIGYLFANWTPVVNNDPVTYEVHVSTTTGFTPSGATKAAEVSGTVIVLEKDGAGAALAYGTTYYVKLIAKDRDGSAAAGAQGSGTLSKVSSLDSALTAADVGATTQTQVDTSITNNNTTFVTPALNGKNKVTHSTLTPGTTSNIAGDTWFQYDGSDRIIGSWRGTGGTSWTAQTIENALIANLDAGKISVNSTFTNTLNVKTTFTLGDVSTPGVIKSYDYNQATKVGFTLSSAGLEIWQGKVIADTLVTGNLASAVITVAAGGQIKSSLYTTSGGTQGYSITDNAFILKSGTVNAAVLEAGSTITNNLSVTGVLTVSSAGSVRSSNYVANTAGYSLSTSGLDIRSGTVSFGTMVGGTVTTTGLIIGAGGQLMIDSTGAIVSNNWTSLTQGWKISATGIELNDANSKIKATAIVGDTVSGRDITVTSGGSIHSSDWNGSTVGWQLSYNGLRINNGTIVGSSVQTDQLTSLATDGVTGLPLFSINAGGFAQFAGAKIRGNTVLGTTSSDYVQSSGFSPGTASGWKIDGLGNATFNNITAYNGTFSGALSGATGTFSGSLSGASGTFTGSIGASQITAGGTIIGSMLRTNSGYPRISVENDVIVYASNGTTKAALYGNPDNTFPAEPSNIWSNTWISCNNGLSMVGSNPTISAANSATGTIVFNVVNGNLTLSGTTNYAARLSNTNADAAVVWKGGAVIFGQATWNNAAVSGGTRAPIYVNKVFSTVANVVDSDARFKKYVRDLDGASAIIESVNIKTFLMKGDEAGAPRKYGIIAQDLLEVLPDAVITTDSDRYAVQYDYLFSVNVAATKELIQKNRALEATVESLEQRLAALEELLAK